MSRAIVITGTDTGIGKTVFSAGLASLLGASYWKPVQAGLDGETDSEAVIRLGGLSTDRVLPEAYRLRVPASPHLAAKIEGVTISPMDLAVPSIDGPLVIEGAGGVMVPLTSQITFLDLFARWRLPVVLCARTRLGTINHTLLSLRALREVGIPVIGVAFVGEHEAATEQAISDLGKVRILGCLPLIDPLNHMNLKTAFRAGFGSVRFL